LNKTEQNNSKLKTQTNSKNIKSKIFFESNDKNQELNKNNTEIEQKINELDKTLSMNKEDDLLQNSLTSSENANSLYEKLNKLLYEENDLNLNYEIMIRVNNYQKTVISEYILTNIIILTQRISNLNQIKNLKNREKNQVTKIANDFVYDQKIVNNLNKNFNKIEDMHIDNIFKILEGEDEENEEDNSMEKLELKKKEMDLESEKLVFKCYEYNQNSLFSLKLLMNQNTFKITQNLR
jgi:hypothetical protein